MTITWATGPLCKVLPLIGFSDDVFFQRLIHSTLCSLQAQLFCMANWLGRGAGNMQKATIAKFLKIKL